MYCPEPQVDEELAKEISQKGRKRKRDPENWKKYVKKPGLRKNSPSVTISNQMKCCKKNCLKSVNTSHLENIRSNFQKTIVQ